jgi:hypothetical protein
MHLNSMSTPAVAALAVLIRQYFSEPAFYFSWCNHAYMVCSRGFPGGTPSGVFLKTAILHSAQSMSQIERFNAPSIPLTASPNFQEGYGRPQLSGLVPLPGTTPLFDLFITDLSTIGEDTSDVYEILISNAQQGIR